VSNATKVFPLPLAFINRPVVEMRADRALVFKAPRIVGSGPTRLLIAGVGMTELEVEVEATGHSD
jgi:hypothetical protein